MAKGFSQAEQQEILRLRQENVTFREIGLILKRRKQSVIDEWHRLTSVPKPEPLRVRYDRDHMPYAQYKRLRTKIYPTWLWQVTFTGLWASVSDPSRRCTTTASSKAARKLSYAMQYAQARDGSEKQAMGILKDSEVFLIRVVDVKISRISQKRKP